MWVQMEVGSGGIGGKGKNNAQESHAGKDNQCSLQALFVPSNNVSYICSLNVIVSIVLCLITQNLEIHT